MTTTPSVEAVSTERLREIIDGCVGVTPGPWDVSADIVRAIDGDLAIPLFDTRDPWKKHRHTSTVVRQAWHNQHHIARLDPSTVSSMARELLELREAVTSARRALELTVDLGQYTAVQRSPILTLAVEAARTALEKVSTLSPNPEAQHE